MKFDFGNLQIFKFARKRDDFNFVCTYDVIAGLSIQFKISSFVIGFCGERDFVGNAECFMMVQNEVVVSSCNAPQAS